MDKASYIILRVLLNNAKVSARYLAERLSITEVAVRKRIKKLEDEGVIVGYKVVIDYQKAGLAASVTGIDIEPNAIWNVIEILKSIDEIRTITITSGAHTIVTEIVAKDLNHLELIHRKIEEINGVRGVYPSMILKQVK